MMEDLKLVASLTVADLMASPVWQHANRDGADSTLVHTFKAIPAENIVGKIVGAQVRFANGQQVWALIGNIDADNPKLAEHFLTLSVERDGKWFALARYHDFDYSERGPNALSQFVGLSVDDVFPISFDVRHYALGLPAALAGRVLREPRERLSRSEVIALAVG